MSGRSGSGRSQSTLSRCLTPSSASCEPDAGGHDEVHCQPLVQCVGNERALPEPGHTSHADKRPERKVHSDIAQIILACPDQFQVLAVTIATRLGLFDLPAATEELASDRILVCLNRFQRSSATRWPPCSPAPGPISTIQSAARMVSSSCSTTMSVLPISRRRSRVFDQSGIIALVQARYSARRGCRAHTIRLERSGSAKRIR